LEKCRGAPQGTPPPAADPENDTLSNEIKTRLGFKIFRASGGTSWEKPMAEAVEFVSTLDRNQIINISHSADEGHGTVVVWYVRTAP
jgi:hypothetical protein